MNKAEYAYSLNGTDWTLECVGGAFPTIPATVPGNIQADLENARCLKPLWYGMGDERIWEVARHDWRYDKEFTVPPAWKGKRIKLSFDGADYACDVYLDGRKIAAHEGQFERFSVDITEDIRLEGSHKLSVLFHKMPPELEEYLQKSDGAGSGEGTPFFFVWGMNKTRQVLRGLKSITNFSYDWGTNIWTMGLWKDVTLYASDVARIEDLRVWSEPDDSYKQAIVRGTWEINSTEDAEGELDILLTSPNSQYRFQQTVRLKAGDNRILWEQTVDDPELWWPAGHGEQPLYTLESKLYMAESPTPSDGRTVRFGIRRLEWGQLDGVPEDFINPLKLTVNGRRIRTMGSNMSSPDLLHGRAHGRGRLYAQRAKEAGFNTLRMHAGQIVFTEDFYDACDEMGLLLSIEFPAGNCIIEEDEDIVRHWCGVVTDMVKLLRNHPSIMEWSGGNEMGWQQDTVHPALEATRAIIAEEDGRYFRATCPAQGVRHAPWDYNAAIHYKLYNDENMRDQTGTYPMMRNGEFGTQTPNNLELLKRTIPPRSRFPIDKNDPVLIRKNMIKAAFNDEVWLMPDNIERLFGKAESFEELIKSAQWMGAEGLRYAFDSLRWRTGMGGFTSWCFNEPWPNGAGSFLVDHDGRPVHMYYGVAQAMEPINLCLKYDSVLFDLFDGLEAELILCSDEPEDVKDLRWRYVLRDRHGDVYRSDEGVASIGMLEAKSLGRITIEPPLPVRTGPVILELYLNDADGKRVNERLYVFGAQGARAPLAGMYKEGLPDPEFGSPPTYTGMLGGSVKRAAINAEALSHESDAEGETLRLRVTNTGEMTALYVETHPLLLYRTDITVHEQFGFIPPGEHRDVTITAPRGEDLTLLQTGWYVTAFNAETAEVHPQDVALWTGRQDRTCEGFAGFDGDGSSATGAISFAAEPSSGRVPAEEVPYLWEQKLEFRFTVGKEQTGKAGTLWIYSADQAEGGAGITARLNDTERSGEIPAGYGFQKTEPWQLAMPQTTPIAFPPEAFQEGENLLVISTVKGWISIDAMNLSFR
ncbi:glycoside hydrolase family 2 protein [Cohnella nanjingensis]|uniref:beta-mannosidase n=1 Tax=Cohnella nanjingensis TaxID=1387779 RepID=A0A7X0VDM6_9BACL|nr:sugar-binding domain-containing protein [Cohnella nanjingensis]MBB6670117.1 hypothetical protein [Cohnella nanjingensis]